MSDWERLKNESQYHLQTTGAVSGIELEAFDSADSREEFEELVAEMRASQAEQETGERLSAGAGDGR
jgi:hypothetical protein